MVFAVAIASGYYLCDLWTRRCEGKSWKQTSGDFEYRITDGKRVSVVNPFSHKVRVVVSDTNGVPTEIGMIPPSSASHPLRVELGYIVTVWDQCPVSLTVVRSPR